jgi:hypothetical protein
MELVTTRSGWRGSDGLTLERMVRENMVAVVVMVKLVLLGGESEQRRFCDFFGELVMMSDATGLGDPLETRVPCA